MLKDLFRRHRTLRLGASLVGASALAIGFASPALAAGTLSGPTGGNAPSQNYNVFQGGSETTYTEMESLSVLFDEAPGCDLTTPSGQQTLDYGCAGLNGEAGVTSSHNGVTTVTGDVTLVSGLPTKVKNVSSLTGLLPGQVIQSDTAGVIPAGDTIKAVIHANQNGPGSPPADMIKLTHPASANHTADSLTIITSPAVGNNSFVPFNQQNPFNDTLVEEPGIGSSNGIQELENQQGHSTDTGVANTSPLDVARSSRAPRLDGGPKTPDKAGLNFVANAMDGVSWICWTEINGSSTGLPCASSALSGSGWNLTTTQLKAIWDNALTCTGPGGVTLTNDWYCIDGGTIQHPIALYMAQNGSGTEDTWATTLGLTGSFPFGGEDANHISNENTESLVIANGDEQYAMYFSSFGKFQSVCAPLQGATGSNSGFTTNPVCANPTGTTGTSKVQMGEVGGIPVNQTTIFNQLPGAVGSVFPIDRLLYNVYSNGSNTTGGAGGTGIAQSSSAALNVVSEDGFVCKPSTNTDVDPQTGKTYRSEISKVITQNGFYPLPLMVEDGQGSSTSPYTTTASGIPHPAWNSGPNQLLTSKYDNTVEGSAPWSFPAPYLDDDNSAVSGTWGTGTTSSTGVFFNGSYQANVAASPTNPVGYCLTLTTDGNTEK